MEGLKAEIEWSDWIDARCELLSRRRLVRNLDHGVLTSAEVTSGYLPSYAAISRRTFP